MGCRSVVSVAGITSLHTQLILSKISLQTKDSEQGPRQCRKLLVHLNPIYGNHCDTLEPAVRLLSCASRAEKKKKGNTSLFHQLDLLSEQR